MAKKQKEKLDYNGLVKSLRSEGPGSLYLLWGEEDYLREQFLGELKKLCLDPDTEEFNHKRFAGGSLDVPGMTEALQAVPFFGDRILIEVRDFDINKCREAEVEALKELLSDIPEYTTVVFLLPVEYEPDGRLSAVKLMKKLGQAVEFTAQGQGAILNWIARRFAAHGKQIGRSEAEYLVFNCGSLMNHLIPEIDKTANYCKGETVTRAHIAAVTTRMPEAEVFEMTDKIAEGDYDGAAAVMATLLGMRQEPIMLLAIIGQQLRRLYIARVALDHGLGQSYLTELCEIRFDFIARKLMTAAGRFRPERLRRALVLCAETDYAMKSSGGSSTELLKELLMRLALEK